MRKTLAFIVSILFVGLTACGQGYPCIDDYLWSVYPEFDPEPYDGSCGRLVNYRMEVDAEGHFFPFWTFECTGKYKICDVEVYFRFYKVLKNGKREIVYMQHSSDCPKIEGESNTGVGFFEEQDVYTYKSSTYKPGAPRLLNAAGGKLICEVTLVRVKSRIYDKEGFYTGEYLEYKLNGYPKPMPIVYIE